MTTVAVRNGIMAADTQGVYEGTKMIMHKIFRVKNELIGVCGGYDNAVDFVTLYKKGKRKEINGDKDKGEDFDYLLLNKSGLYLATGFYGPQIKIHERFWAIGTGKDAALTAMRMGATAKEAVKMAHLCDIYTGPQVQERKL